MDLNTVLERSSAPARRPGRVGAEVELIPVTDTARPRPVDPSVLAAGFDAGVIMAAVPTFEPGGQLELSPAPRPTAAALVRDLEGLLRRAAAIAAAHGVRLGAVGLNSYHSCADLPLRLRTRYLAMQRMFDEVGPNGRRLTASLQITVELLPGCAGLQQWLVAKLAGSPRAAAFANSGSADGRPAGMAGARTRIWQTADVRRTRYDGRHLDLLDPVGAFAAAAPRLSIPEAGRPSYHLSTLSPGAATRRLPRGALSRRAAVLAHRRGSRDRGRAAV